MAKSPTKPTTILPLVYSAVSKRKLYPSKAKDSGTCQRNATHLTQIVLNLLNGADECSDQMAASAVYNLPSSVSSHSFTNLYAVDFINYVKSGGKSLQEDSNVLDLEDLDSDVEKFKEDDSDVLATTADSGLGQGAKPVHDRLSEDEGGGIRITIARDIQDYIYCGDALSWLPPFVYKALIRRVSKKIVENLSTKESHAGAQKSLIFPFDEEHPLSHTHIQRLNKKPLIVKLVGRGLPTDFGPWQGQRNGKEFEKWSRKYKNSRTTSRLFFYLFIRL